jgi:hypothetical protein
MGNELIDGKIDDPMRQSREERRGRIPNDGDHEHWPPAESIGKRQQCEDAERTGEYQRNEEAGLRDRKMKLLADQGERKRHRENVIALKKRGGRKQQHGMTRCDPFVATAVHNKIALPYHTFMQFIGDAGSVPAAPEPTGFRLGVVTRKPPRDKV